MLASCSSCKGADCCLGTVTVFYPALVNCLVVSGHVKTGQALLQRATSSIRAFWLVRTHPATPFQFPEKDRREAEGNHGEYRIT